jgi:2-haloacid dehalogenase
MSTKIKNVVFDFGGVLIDWNPRYLYRKVFNDDEAMERFLSEVCNGEWNEKHDGGRPFREGIEELITKYPDESGKITMYFDRWEEMVGGEINGTPGLIYELKSLGYALYGLTNWSGETFPRVKPCFGFLQEFDGIVVSGDEKLLKPDPAIFRLMIDRYDLIPEESLFIDDNPKNVEVAKSLGFETIRFESAVQLKQDLRLKEILK